MLMPSALRVPEKVGKTSAAELHGSLDPEERAKVTAAFQAAPDVSPVRILLATDAASDAPPDASDEPPTSCTGRAAMEGDPSLKVPLTQPIRVVIYYVTASVIPAENAVHFADDIYDQDPALDKALKERKNAT